MKKQIFITGLLVLGALSSMAQNLVYSNGQHSTYIFSDENFIYYDINVATPTAEDVIFKWELISNGIPDGWNYSLCDHGNCYVGIAAGGEMDKITKEEAEAGTEGFLKFNINPKSYGGGTVFMYVYVKGDYSRGDTVSLHVWNRDLVGVNEIASTEQIFLYPNPANSQLNIELANSNSIESVRLLNSVGQVVLELGDINSSSTTLDVAEMESGMYIVECLTSQGIITKKISIQ
ncbi:MAG: T9SS type A sorting domain-containing protein [Bacteroidia bacterium]